MSSPLTVKMEKVDSSDEADDLPLLEFIKEEDRQEINFGASTSRAPSSKRKRKLQDDYDDDATVDLISCPSTYTEEEEDDDMDQYYVLHIKCENEMKLIEIEKDSLNRKTIITKISQAFPCSINYGTVKTNLGAPLSAKIFLTVVKQYMNSASFYLEVEKANFADSNSTFDNSVSGSVLFTTTVPTPNNSYTKKVKEDDLANILRAWDLFEDLHQFLKEKKITFKILRYAKERHLDEIFGGEKIASKILLEHHLSQIQRDLRTYSMRAPDPLPKPITDKADSAKQTADTQATTTVHKILNASTHGKEIIACYKKNKCLSPGDRTAIVHMIVQHFIANGKSMPVELCKQLAQDIVTLFDTEIIETYFVQQCKSLPPKGKLWNCLQGRKRSMRNLTASHKKQEKNQDSSVETTTTASVADNSELSAICTELKHITEWEVIVPKWKQTFSYRRQQLQRKGSNSLTDILNEWPLLKSASAPLLVDMDYITMHPSNEMNYMLWRRFCAKIEDIFPKWIKDRTSKTFFYNVMIMREKLNDDLQLKTIGTQTDVKKVIQNCCPAGINVIKEDIHVYLMLCGKNILDEYNENNSLSDRSRKKLINLVVDLLTHKCGFYPTRDEKIKWAQATAHLFPQLCEQGNPENYEIFFDPANRGGYFGHRLKTVNRMAGHTSRLSVKHQQQQQQQSSLSNTAASNDIESEKEHECSHSDDIAWLQNAVPYTQEAEIRERMKNTICCREQCSNILERFPRFIDVPGLIAQDFDLKFPAQGFNFISRWNQVITNIENFAFARKINIYAETTSSEYKWDRITTSFLSLQKIFTSKRSDENFELIKFQLIGTDPPTATGHHPFLIAYGAKRSAISRYFIYLDGQELPIGEQSSLNAWDTLFKSYFVFNCKYHPSSKFFLTFIMEAIYQMGVAQLTAKMRDIKAKLCL